MAKLPIVQYPDPRLSTVCKPVTVFDEALKRLADDMAQTMYEAPGVGLAAPQVGHLIRLIVVDVSEEKNALRVFVNPTIEPIDEETVLCEEGCLSLPGIYEKVARPKRVRISAQDLEGKPFSLECDELLGICVQHEVDHLNGLVFVDHLSKLKKFRAIARLAKERKEKAREAKHKAMQN